MQHVSAGSLQLDLRPLLYEPSIDPAINLRSPTGRRPPPPPGVSSGSKSLITGSPGSAVPCRPSNLGYRCSVSFPKGVIHYTIGGPLPDNACTRAAAAVVGTSRAGNTTQSSLQATDMAHFALEGATSGYLALAIGQEKGRMYPADAVMGFMDTAGAADVRSYHINGLSVADEDEYAGWAVNTAVLRGGNSTLLCFSRALYEPAAQVMKNIPAGAAVASSAAAGAGRRRLQQSSNTGEALAGLMASELAVPAPRCRARRPAQQPVRPCSAD